MDMFSAEDLRNVASSKVQFGDEELSKEDNVPASKEDTVATETPAPVIQQPEIVKVVKEETENMSTPQAPPPVEAVSEEDQEFVGKSVDSLLGDGNWKARKFGYGILVSTFERETPPGVSIKSILKESVVGALDNALDCALVFFKHQYNGDDEGQLVSKSVALLFPKALSGRPGTVKRAEDLVLSMMEVNAGCMKCALEALLEGLKQKNPKLVAECINCAQEAVKAFGAMILPLAALQDLVKTGLTQTNPAVRKSATALAVEIDGWFSGAFKDIIVQLIEADSTRKELEKALDAAAKPTDVLIASRSLRGTTISSDIAVPTDQGAPDLFDVLPEKNLLDFVSKMNLEKLLQEPKWTDRKNTITEIENFCGKVPKLENGDYTDLVRLMKGVIQKDSNQAVVVQAIQLLGILGLGLRGEFSHFARSSLSMLLFKFRDKKAPLISSVAATLDTHAAHCFNLTEERIMNVVEENVSSAGDSGKMKSTPLQKLNITEWILRCLKGGWLWKKPNAFEPPGMKRLITILVNLASDGDSKVRSTATECIALLQTLDDSSIPEPVVKVLQNDLQKCIKSDPKLISKIHAAEAPVEKKSTQPPKPPATNRVAKPTAIAVAKPKKVAQEVVEEDSHRALLASETASEMVRNSLTDPAFGEAETLFENAAKWQDKLVIFEFIVGFVDTSEVLEQELGEALIVFIGIKTKSFKESNFNVINKAWEAIKAVVDKSDPVISKSCANFIIEGVVKKFGDKKLFRLMSEVLLAISESCGPKFVTSRILKHIEPIVAPKANEDACNMLALAAKEFGAGTVNVRDIVTYCAGDRGGLTSRTKPNKDAAVACLVELYTQLGEPIRQAMGNSITDVVDAAFTKAGHQGPSSVARTVKNASQVEPQPDLMDDLNPRVDVSSSFNATLLGQLGDESSKASWKGRLKAIDDIVAIVDAANGRIQMSKAVKHTVAELRKRLNDTNRNLVTKAVVALGVVGGALGGEGAAVLAKATGEHLFNCLGDGKKAVVIAAETALEKWTVHDGVTSREAFIALLVQSHVPLANSKLDRKVILCWFNKHLPVAAETMDAHLYEVLVQLAVPILACLQSRDPATRKATIGSMSMVASCVGVDESRQLFVDATRDLKKAVKLTVTPLIMEAHDGAALPVDVVVEEASTKSHIAPLSKRTIKKEAVVTKTTAIVEAVENCGPWFKPVDPSLKVRRRAKAEKNKWPILFDEKDKRRMQECTDSLKEDFEKVINRDLLSKMFTAADDGRQARGSALDPAFNILIEEMPNYPDEALACIDLLLKWSTLQLLNNNSTVTINVMNLLESVFELAIGADYALNDVEANSFLPHLLTKLGEKQKRFRDSIRGIMIRVCHCYPFPKYIPFVFAELSPKQRSIYVLSECLGETARLIREHGLAVLKVKLGVGNNLLCALVSFVDDSRKDVRNSSLETIEQIWEHLGRNKDDLFALISLHKAILSDKSKTLVENYLNSALQRNLESELVEPSVVKPPSRTLKLNKIVEPLSPVPSRSTPKTRPVSQSKLACTGLFQMELPATPPSPTDKKRFARTPTYEKENDPSTESLSHAMLMSSATPENHPHKADLPPSKKYTILIARIEPDVRAYRDLLRSNHGDKSMSTRDNGIKAMGLVGSKEPPADWPGASQKEWIELLSCMPVVQVLDIFLDLVDDIACTRVAAESAQNESRLLKLVLPAVFTLSWWPELRNSVDASSCKRWVNVMTNLIGRFLVQQDDGDHVFEKSSLSPEELHDINTERTRLVKISQTILAKLSETSIWLPSVLQTISQTDSRLKSVLCSALVEYIAIQESMLKPYNNVALKETGQALGTLLAQPAPPAICENLVHSMLKTGKRFTDAILPAQIPGQPQPLRVLMARLLMEKTGKPVVVENIEEDDKIVLASIFSRITSAINSAQFDQRTTAFAELFKFDDSHPGFDATTYLADSSDWFRNYILEELNKHRSKPKETVGPSEASISSIRDRLSQLRSNVHKRETVDDIQSPPSSPVKPQVDSAASTIESIRERMARLRSELNKS